MRYRKLNADGDMTFGHQQADFHRDTPAAVAQAVRTRLQLWRGDWFLDDEEGTPYQQAILGMHTSKSLEPALRERILSTPGVSAIDDFQVIRDGEQRTVTVQVALTTQYGEAVLTEVL